MKSTWLNLATLRDTSPHQKRPARSVRELLLNPTARLSRRQMLGFGLSGATALSVMSPGFKAMAGTASGPFEVAGDSRRVALTLGGEERFVIDTSRFTGKPQLTVTREDRLIRIELENARWPGTDIPADMVCEIKSTLLGRTLTIRMHLGSFAATLPLEHWLNGRRAASSVVHTDARICTLGTKGRLGVVGTAEAAFYSDWSLRFNGDGFVRMDGFGSEILSDALTLSLSDVGDGSLMSNPPASRTMMSFPRGAHNWPIEPATGEASHWNVVARESPFDVIHVETAETRNGKSRRSILAESNSDETRLWVAPASGMVGSLGETFKLPLRRARYAVAFEGTGHETALVAGYGSRPVWLHSRHGSLLVGDSNEGRQFEMLTRNGAIGSVVCSPSLLMTYIPPIDSHNVIIEPVAAEPGEHVEITSFDSSKLAGTSLGTKSPGIDTLAGEQLALVPPPPPPDSLRRVVTFDRFRPDDPPLYKLARPKLSVVRPEDLLVLNFEFVNLDLDSSGPKPKLVRRSGATPLIVVHFPPQNIAEQALFEADPDVPSANTSTQSSATDKPPADPDTGKKGSSTSDKPSSFPPPVASRISGPSRLVFRMPSSETSIDYSLQALLTACNEYPLNVAPTALEPGPEEQKRLVILNHIQIPNDILLNTDGLSGDVASMKNVRVKMTARTGISHTEQLIRASRTQIKVQTAVNTMKMQAEQPWKSPKAVLVDPSIVAVLKPKIVKPTKDHTAIESPFRLIISPNKYGAFTHAIEPVAGSSGRVELWHTRLIARGNGIDPSEPRYMTIRAIWARDQSTFEKPGFDAQNPQLNPPHSITDPFRMTLDSFDRFNVVHLTSNYYLKNPPPQASIDYKPVPVSVNRLMLSALGSWMDVRGAWDKLPRYLSVEEWKHRATMGRDHYVKVVYAGFLFPYGHRASLIKITERKIFNDGPSGPIAFLFQRMFIVVREPEKSFRNTDLVVDEPLPADEGKPGAKSSKRSVDLEFPFTSVKIKTLITPNLDRPDDSDIQSLQQSCFWPEVGHKDFLFHVVAEDVDGRSHEYTTPMAFIGKEITDDDSKRSVILDLAARFEKGKLDNGESNDQAEQRRTRPMNGQKIVFAEYSKPGDTTFETKSITFGAEVPQQSLYNAIPWNRPRFFPVMRKGDLVIPSIKQMAGTDKPGGVEFSPIYIEHAFAKAQNQGEVLFNMIAGKEVELNFSKQGQKSGALVAPNMNITGLSRVMGPVGGDPKKIAGGEFDPVDFFSGLLSDLSPKIFGVISLWDIVGPLASDLINKLDLVPKFVSETLDKVEAFLTRLEELKNTADRLVSYADPNKVLVPANNIKNKLTEIADTAFLIIDPSNGDIAKFFQGDLDPATVDGKLATLQTHIEALATKMGELSGLLDVPTAGVADGEIKQLRSILKDVQGVLGKIDDFLDGVRSFIGMIPTELPKQLTVKFEWKPEINSWGLSPGHPIFVAKEGSKKASLVIGVRATVKTDGSAPPEAEVYCSLENFVIDLIAPVSLIALHFKQIKFSANTGLKTDISVDLTNIEFVGPLSFVETIKKIIPLDGFSDPPAIDVSEKGIQASFSLPIPSVAVGVLSIQNISLGCGFSVPFIGDPLSVYFNFCTKESPFLLTVMMFGGGGFFTITLDPAGIQSFEAAFEFGASLSVDFGVASGGVEVMAGLYFKMTLIDGKENALLKGYLRIRGWVDVLGGIISASIELNMEISYESASGKCIGRASLIIEINVFIFSGHVEISCEKKFAGSNSDPSFCEVMGKAQLVSPIPGNPDNTVEVFPWKDYCESFA
jgi:hypothetical protein